MSTRSITPLSSCSAPMGISVATTCRPYAPLSCSSVRKKSARSRSSMFTNSIRAMSSSAARAHRRAVETSTPITAFTTKIADSHTRSAPSASATKLGSPGVSSRLILRSPQSKELSAVEIDIWRACSSGSASATVLPSVTDPSRLTTPASNSSASCSEVFPAPRWPTRATLRIRSAAVCMWSPSRGKTTILRPARPRQGCFPSPPGLPTTRCTHSPRHRPNSPGQSDGSGQSKESPCIRERRRRTAFVCSWEMRDSVTPSTSPISRSVRFS